MLIRLLLVCDCFHTTVAELSSWGSDYLAHNAQETSHLALSGKLLLTLALTT